MLKKSISNSLKVIIFASTLCNIAIAASNFTLAPTAGTTIPTTVPSGSIVYACYTVTNNTTLTLPRPTNPPSYYHIVGLATTVTQDTSGSQCPATYPPCQSNISLAGGASCNLQLNISGKGNSPFSLCNGNSCTTAAVPLNVSLRTGGVAVGGNLYLPFNSLSYTSTDGGVNWTQSNTTFSDTGFLSSVACDSTGEACTAVGSIYSNKTYPTDSLSYTSTNGGVSWTPSKTTFSDKGALFSVACDNTGKTCTAVGAVYVGGNPADSLSYTSTNGGVSWTRSTTTFSDGGALDGVACDSTGKTCTAVGAVYAGPNPVDSLSYTSTNGGVSWTRSTTTFSDGGSLDNVACDSTGKTCTAVGYTPTNSLSYTSTNGGVSWTVSTTTFSDGGYLNGVACDSTGKTCTAVGSNKNNSLSYTSTNGGVSWTVSTTTFSDGGYLNSVACDSTGKTCTAVGTNTYNSISYTSTDGGVNWALSTTTFSDNGALYGVAGIK